MSRKDRLLRGGIVDRCLDLNTVMYSWDRDTEAIIKICEARVKES